MNDDEKARVTVILDEFSDEMEEILDDMDIELNRLLENIAGVTKSLRQNINILKEQLDIR